MEPRSALDSSAGFFSLPSETEAERTPGSAPEASVESTPEGASSEAAQPIETSELDSIRSELAAIESEDRDQASRHSALLEALESRFADASIHSQAWNRLRERASDDTPALRNLQADLWTWVASAEASSVLGEGFIEILSHQESLAARRVVYSEFVRFFPSDAAAFRERLIADGFTDESMGLLVLEEQVEAADQAHWQSVQTLVSALGYSRQSSGRMPARAFAE